MDNLGGFFVSLQNPILSYNMNPMFWLLVPQTMCTQPINFITPSLNIVQSFSYCVLNNLQVEWVSSSLPFSSPTTIYSLCLKIMEN